MDNIKIWGCFIIPKQLIKQIYVYNKNYQRIEKIVDIRFDLFKKCNGQTAKLTVLSFGKTVIKLPASLQ